MRNECSFLRGRCNKNIAVTINYGIQWKIDYPGLSVELEMGALFFMHTLP
jgi:hypothetical protein